jgi:hypothetical protein
MLKLKIRLGIPLLACLMTAISCDGTAPQKSGESEVLACRAPEAYRRCVNHMKCYHLKPRQTSVCLANCSKLFCTYKT